jgi:RNA recognition motif-containing protein
LVLRFDPETTFGRHLFCQESYAVGKKLYVGNLSYEMTNESLEDLFSPFGSVRSAQVIQDRDTGRSKGFGFVEMSDDNAARAAINALNDKDQDGRRLTVNEARPREDRGSGGGRGNFSRR